MLIPELTRGREKGTNSEGGGVESSKAGDITVADRGQRFISSLIRTIAMSLSLNCLVLGDELEKIFTVEVEKTKNVSILKKLIKEEKAPHLDHVAASELDLWMVDRCLDERKLGAELVLDTQSKIGRASCRERV